MKKSKELSRVKVRVLVSALMSGVIAMSFVACGNSEESIYAGMSKAELVEQCELKDIEINSVNEQYTELSEAVRGKGLVTENTPIIIDMNDGTGRTTFQSVDNIITFEEELRYPNSYEPANTSGVMISKNVSCKPYENWLIQQYGCRTEFYHVSGVSGKVVIGNLEGVSNYYPISAEDELAGASLEEVTVDSLKKNTVEPWMKKLATVGDIRYKNLYVNSTIVGVQAESTTLINGGEAHITVGIFNTNMGESCEYVFLYTGAYDTLKEEYINTLISSTKVGESKLLVE